MTISLGGITLSEDMFLDKPFCWAGVAGSVDRSLGGGLIIWESTLIGGEFLDLVAEADSGWILKTVVKQLLALASLAGSTYELNYRDHLYNVRFRHEDSPALDLVPCVTRIEFESDSYYYGRIKLMVVD